MIWKLLVTAGVFVLIWLFLFRAGRSLTGRGPRRDDAARPKGVPAQDFVKCAGCGIYLPPGRACDCGDRA